MAIDILIHMQTFAACTTGGSFFDFPTWYKYLNCGADGQIEFTSVNSFNGSVPIFEAIPLIGLAVLEIALRIAGMAAVIFVIYGGITYVVSQGDSAKIAEAKGTIINALIGMVIAVLAVAIVNFVGSKLA